MTILSALIGLFLPKAYAVSITDYDWRCNGFLFCNSSDNAVTAIAGNIISAVSYFIIPVATVIFMYGGVRWVVSQGGEGKEAGKKAMQYAALGLLFALFTQFILQYISGTLFLIGSNS